MEEKQHPTPLDVAHAFVKQFYVILNQCPQNLHKFYQEQSLQGWPKADGVVIPVTTLSGISENVMSSEYKYCSVDIKTTNAQESIKGGIVVAVTGCLTTKNNVQRNFSQTFFLAKQEKGFFVLNDILQFCCVCEPSTKAAPTQDSGDTRDGATALNFKAAIQNGKVMEEKNPASPPKGTKPQPVDTPDVKPSSSNVATKITYASMLAKETLAVSPSGGVSSTSKVAPKSPSAYSEAKGIYIGGLPYDISKQGVMDVVKQFGHVKNDPDTTQIRRHEDGFCCGFVEFESADSARRAVEAHHVMFGDKEAYIMPKKPYNRGNNGRARPATRRGPHNDNSGTTENGDWSNYGQRPRQTNP